MSVPFVLNLPPQSIKDGAPKVKAVLEKALKQVGFIPNMYSFMANSPGMLETYLFG